MLKPLWEPAAERVQGSLLTRFKTNVTERWGQSLSDYDELWAWSVTSPSAFWESVWDFCGVIGERGAGPVVEHPDEMRRAKFFPDAKLNYAENLLRRTGSDVAVAFYGEDGSRRTLNFEELRQQVSLMQQALRESGVSKGDRVAGVMPNTPETLVAMLATASLGAVWSSCSPDFGAEALLDRLSQVHPKVLFVADGYFYNGNWCSSLATIDNLSKCLPALNKIVVATYAQKAPSGSSNIGQGVFLSDFISSFQARDIEYVRVSFNAPLFIMFSSGTTGLPKCIVHSVGGSLIQHLKEHQLQCDIKPADRLFYFTTCGWMMWNWLASGLASDASIILFDGSPFYPDGTRLADIVEAERVTHFGVSAKYLDACSKADIKPMETHNFDALRTILSTGSPLAPDSFDYVYRNWKKDICLSSIAGGTDILGCFVGGNPIGPVFRGESQKRHLGMNVCVYGDKGEAAIGEAGELVCLSAHPSMPIGFLNDPDSTRYDDAYFDKYEGIWCHGDWVELTGSQGMIFHGRSDATLNPGGVRIGTAEIYRQVEAINEVIESVVIGQQWENDVRVVLFVRLRDGQDLTDVLIERIKNDIRLKASPRHVPSVIAQVNDIPRTRSGKISEIAVADVVHGRKVRNIDSLQNPEALALYEGLSFG